MNRVYENEFIRDAGCHCHNADRRSLGLQHSQRERQRAAERRGRGDARGRGAYAYLTGSASWLLLTLLTESFGVKGRLGDCETLFARGAVGDRAHRVDGFLGAASRDQNLLPCLGSIPPEQAPDMPEQL